MSWKLIFSAARPGRSAEDEATLLREAAEFLRPRAVSLLDTIGVWQDEQEHGKCAEFPGDVDFAVARQVRQFLDQDAVLIVSSSPNNPAYLLPRAGQPLCGTWYESEEVPPTGGYTIVGDKVIVACF